MMHKFKRASQLSSHPAELLVSSQPIYPLMYFLVKEDRSELLMSQSFVQRTSQSANFQPETLLDLEQRWQGKELKLPGEVSIPLTSV